MTDPDALTPVALSWAARLRGGVPVLWSDFRDGTDRPSPIDRSLPGSAALEVVRRLAEVRSSTQDFGGLADLVFATEPVGRGRVDPPLPGSAAHQFGTNAVEPDRLPPAELLRVCLGVLVRLLPDVPDSRLPVAVRHRGPRFACLGWPEATRVVRDALVAGGGRPRPPDSRRTATLVLTGPLPELVAGFWAVRTRRGEAAAWPRLWARAHARGRLPDAVTAPAQAVPPGATLLVGARPAEVAALAAHVLGVDPVPIGAMQSPAASDLLRRLHPVLALAAGDRAAAVGRSCARLMRDLAPYVGPAPGVPVAHRDFALDQAQRLADALATRASTAVGDPGLVVPSSEALGRPGVRPADTLEVALSAISAAWEASAQVRKGSRTDG